MIATAGIDPKLVAIAAELPGPEFSTEELLLAGRQHLSDKFVEMVHGVRVEKRHSVLVNYPDVLFEGAEPKWDISTTDLAVRAARKCLAKTDVPAESIGLVLGVTTSPGRQLPSLVCDMIARMPEIPRTVANLSIEFMGCCGIPKAVDAARWYLNANPDKHVLICFAEAVTPHAPVLPDFYKHFTEGGEEDYPNTMNALHGFLFADAAVAMILGAEGSGPSFGPVVSLTNVLPEDAELGIIPDGGSDDPVLHGRRTFVLHSDEVIQRAPFYGKETIGRLLQQPTCTLSEASEASVLLMHTGTPRILDLLCAQFGIPNDSETVASSYEVLRDYGNTLGCTIPLMLAQPKHRQEGQGILVAFGLSFSAGAFTMTVPEGGWTP